MRASILAAVLLLGTIPNTSTTSAPAPADLDTLLAPVALYPDQLLGPMLVCAGNPGKVAALSEWMRSHDSTKGSELQAAATEAGFDDCYVALLLFPDVVNWMASQSAWMSKVGAAFVNDRSAVFASVQRLRGKAKAAGTLKSTPQQTVETKTTSGGDQVIVIEPANSQVVYVPQYNPQTVYVQQPTTSTVVVQQSSSSSDAALAGVIGFTAGVAIGAMWDNNYYGPYGWHGGYMYNDAWDDWYDHREDAREDWQDHREDMADEYGDRAKNAQENRTERRENTQNSRTDRQQNRQENGTTTDRQQQRSGSTASAATQSTGGRTQESRGFSGDGRTAGTRSGTGSTAFSGYSSGGAERAASSRGQRSRSSARSGGSRRR